VASYNLTAGTRRIENCGESLMYSFNQEMERQGRTGIWSVAKPTGNPSAGRWQLTSEEVGDCLPLKQAPIGGYELEPALAAALASDPNATASVPAPSWQRRWAEFVQFLEHAEVDREEVLLTSV
jgi:hypothetical protein